MTNPSSKILCQPLLFLLYRVSPDLNLTLPPSRFRDFSAARNQRFRTAEKYTRTSSHIFFVQRLPETPYGLRAVILFGCCCWLRSNVAAEYGWCKTMESPWGIICSEISAGPGFQETPPGLGPSLGLALELLTGCLTCTVGDSLKWASWYLIILVLLLGGTPCFGVIHNRLIVYSATIPGKFFYPIIFWGMVLPFTLNVHGEEMLFDSVTLTLSTRKFGLFKSIYKKFRARTVPRQVLIAH